MTVYRIDVTLDLVDGGVLPAVTYVDGATKTEARGKVDAALRDDQIMPPFSAFTITSCRVEHLVDDHPEED